LLNQVVLEIYEKYHNKNITKILTAAVDGIPLAVLSANQLGIDTLIAKKSREAGVSEFLTENYSPGRTGMIISLYLPAKLISNQDRILIIEDIIRSGETQKALCRLVTKAGAIIYGIFTLIGIGEERWREQLKKTLLINYLNYLNIKNNEYDRALEAFDNKNYDIIRNIIKNKNVGTEINLLIENLLNNKLIEVFVNIPEP